MDAASYNFQAIVTTVQTTLTKVEAWQFLMKVATGKLSFPENSVAIYKVKVDADDNGAFLMWHLK